MAQIIVRNIEAEVKSRLQRRAKRHHRSMEEEVREIWATPSGRKMPPKVAWGAQSRLCLRTSGWTLKSRNFVAMGLSPRP